MKKAIIAILVILGVTGLISLIVSKDDSSVTSVQIPSAVGHVNDYANIISAEKEGVLEEDLKVFPHEIAVLTVESLGGLTIEDYGIKVAEAWKVGDAKEDDGVILIVSTGDRKVRIEVGYGAEAKLNDSKVGRILDESVVPHFKNNDWEGGILEGVLSIKAALK